MIIYPAVDIKSGKCVRLMKGEAGSVTEYGDPVEMAAKWSGMGAQWLHIVDLDGAFSGISANLATIKKIAGNCKLKIQLGGGIRTMDDIELRMEMGAARVVLGTAAIENPVLAAVAARKYPGRIAVGIDVKDGSVAVQGWVKASNVKPLQLALLMKDSGIETIIFTDISRDGMMAGPNIAQTSDLLNATGMEVIASGGIRNLSDLQAIQDAGIPGAITGKALYEGTLDLAAALQLQGMGESSC